MHLAQPVVPLQKSLSRKILQQCHDTEENLQVTFQLSCWTDFCHHQNQKEKISLVYLTVLPLQYYHPVLFLPFTFWKVDSENPSLQSHKFVFRKCWRHLNLVLVYTHHRQTLFHLAEIFLTLGWQQFSFCQKLQIKIQTWETYKAAYLSLKSLQNMWSTQDIRLPRLNWVQCLMNAFKCDIQKIHSFYPLYFSSYSCKYFHF